MSDTMEKVLLIGGIGIAAYFAYEYLFSTAAAASTTTATTATGCAAPNMLVGGECLPPATASGTPATSTGPAQGQSLANVFSALTAKVQSANDPAVTTSGGVISANPDVFNYYLAEVFTPSGSSPWGWPPNTLQVFPGVNRETPMSITTYWAGVSAYLSSQMGMSGLGIFAGLGMVIAANRGGYGWWPEVAGPQFGGAGRPVQ
jgi:hypothetical protein